MDWGLQVVTVHKGQGNPSAQGEGLAVEVHWEAERIAQRLLKPRPDNGEAVRGEGNVDAFGGESAAFQSAKCAAAALARAHDAARTRGRRSEISRCGRSVTSERMAAARARGPERKWLMSRENLAASALICNT